MLYFFFAFLAGIVTIAGPCILPLLPIILGTSTVRPHPARPLFIILGFTLSFTGFAILFSLFGSQLGISANVLRWIAMILIGCFGIVMIFPKVQEKLLSLIGPFLSRITPRTNIEHQGLFSGFLLGASLGIVWTPCAGPVLGSILTLVASKQHLAQSGSLLFAYAIGAALPMLLIAYGGQAAITRVRALTKHTETIQRFFGILVILVAVGIATGFDRDAQIWLVTHAPWLFQNLNANL